MARRRYIGNLLYAAVLLCARDALAASDIPSRPSCGAAAPQDCVSFTYTHSNTLTVTAYEILAASAQTGYFEASAQGPEVTITVTATASITSFPTNTITTTSTCTPTSSASATKVKRLQQQQGSVCSMITTVLTIWPTATLPSTAATTQSNSGDPVPPPAPTTTGTTNLCYKWYVADGTSTCYGIQQTYDISFGYLQQINKGIDDTCDNLQPGYAYCVNGAASFGAGGTSTAIASSTAATVGPPYAVNSTSSSMYTSGRIAYTSTPYPMSLSNMSTTAPSTATTSACSCNIDTTVDTHETTTITITPSPVTADITSTSSHMSTATVSVTTILTSIAPAATVTVQAATYNISTYSGTYTTSNGDIYTLYSNDDFAGYDAFNGLCDGSSTSGVSTNLKTYACASYDECIDICTQENDDGGTLNGMSNYCTGVSYTPQGEPNSGVQPTCYLKYASPNHGMDGCGVVQVYVVDSAILEVRGTV